MVVKLVDFSIGIIIDSIVARLYASGFRTVFAIWSSSSIHPSVSLSIRHYNRLLLWKLQHWDGYLASMSISIVVDTVVTGIYQTKLFPKGVQSGSSSNNITVVIDSIATLHFIFVVGAETSTVNASTYPSPSSSAPLLHAGPLGSYPASVKSESHSGSSGHTIHLHRCLHRLLQTCFLLAGSTHSGSAES